MAQAKRGKANGTRVGVLLTLRGGPAHLADVAPFLRAVLSREPSSEELQEATVRYLTIGGGSPATLAAERIAAALERKLNGLPEAEMTEDDLRTIAVLGGGSGRTEEPVEMPVATGCLLTAPGIRDAVVRLEAAGCARIVHVDLNPLEPCDAVAAREEAVRAAASAVVVKTSSFLETEPMARLLGHAALVAWDALTGCARRLVLFVYPAADVGEAPVSVPARAVMDGLSSVLSLPRADTGAVTERLGVEVEGGAGDTTWAIASVGDEATEGVGAGRRLLEIVEAAVARGFDGVAVIPVGYTVDDEATLHLMDVLAADIALVRDVEFSRARVPNDDPLLIDALDAVVKSAIHAV
jgi:protoheme ferro-lyase